MSLPELFDKTRRPLGLEGPPPSPGVEAAAGGLPGPGPVLGLRVPYQDGDFWCWAAVGVGVRRFLRGQLTRQCDLAKDVLGGTLDCCHNPQPCDVIMPLEVALSRAEVFAGMVMSPVPVETLGSEIADRRRPVCCAVRWFADGRFHFVAIHGFSVDSAGRAWVAVGDPFNGPWKGRYEDFLNAYRNQGSWIASYFTA